MALTKFDAWWTARGPMHLGELDSGKSFCGLVERLQGTTAPWYDSDTHKTTPSLIRLHLSDTFPPYQRYCKRCAKHALRAMEDAT